MSLDFESVLADVIIDDCADLMQYGVLLVCDIMELYAIDYADAKIVRNSAEHQMEIDHA